MPGTVSSYALSILWRSLPSARCASLPVVLVAMQVTAFTAYAGLAGLERLQTGLDRPVFVTHAPADRDRLFIVEKSGAIRILDLTDNSLNAQVFLTVSNLNISGEGGVLGLAFHPNYQSNGKFYVYATLNDGGAGSAFRSHVLEYTVSASPDVANSTPTDIISWDQPQSNHNAGWIGFGPNDGYLYIMSGDGGGSNDDDAGHTAGTGNAQDITNNFLGKALRIDVNGTSAPGGNYDIPSSNPFVGVTGDDEIWAYGLRNPWRASFDRQNGDLWIGDVGQSSREEIDKQLAASIGGENYGWRIREGFIQNPAFPDDDPNGPVVDPVHDYQRTGNPLDIGRSTVGGYVYRGPDPELQGTYLFGDSVSNNIWTLDAVSPTGTVQNVLADLPLDIGQLNAMVSFGEDAVGNLYVLDIASSLFPQTPNTGELYRVITDTLVPGDFDADGDVDDQDLPIWESGYGTESGALSSDGDADGDGTVDGNDFLLWQSNLGSTAQDPPNPISASTAVPEPATVLLALVGLAAGAIAAARRNSRFT